LNEIAEMAALPPDADSSRKKRRRPSGRTECGLGLLASLIGLLASRAGYLWIGFDIFAQFTVHFAIAAAAFLIGLLLPRARVFSALVLILAGVVALGLWPHLASRDVRTLAAVPEGHRQIKVASLNLWYANRNYDAVRAEILRLDADVVTLIEIHRDKRPMLDALKASYPYQATCFTIDYCNLAVLSKVPIVESDARVRWVGAPMIRAKLGPELGGLTVIGVHAIRFPHSRAQFRQVTALSDLIETIPGRKLVMGDFNSTAFSRILETMVSRTNLVRLTNLPSWPATFGLPQVAIDHIFVSRGIIQTKSQQIGEPSGSDHYPITLSIAVPLGP